MLKKTNKIILCFVTAFALLFFFTPTCHAAFDIATPIVIAILQAICQLILLLTTGLLGLAGGFLEIMASPHFITAKYTSNEFVTLGLNITLGFANIIILLSLLAIGIGTALRLDKFDARKNFANLLIVIFLINFFAPIFCGLIIDAANIIMNFFMGSGLSASKVFSNALTAQGNNLASHFRSLSSMAEFLDPRSLMQVVIMIVFNISLAIVLFLFGILFAMRYAALWTLVILSPLAFACYILPSTRKIFNTWFSQFINWSFVGASAAFFLYLGQQMIGLISQGNLVMAPSGQDTGFFGMDTVMPYLVAITFLFIGFFVSLNTSAMGSGAVISYAQGQTRKLGSWGSKKFLKEPVRDMGKGMVRSGATGTASNKLSAIGKNLSPSWGEGKKGIGGWAQRQAAKGLGTFGRATEATGTALSMKRDEYIDETTKKAEKMKAKELPGALKGGVLGEKNTLSNGLVLVSYLKDKDKGKNKAAKKELEVMTKEQIEAMIGGLLKEGKNKEADILGSIALLAKAKDKDEIKAEDIGFKAEDIGKEGWKKGKWKNQTDRLMDNIDVDAIKKYGGDISNSEPMMNAAAKLWGGNKIKAAAEEFEGNFIEKYCEAADAVGFEEMLSSNPGALMFRVSNAAQDSGFTLPKKDGQRIGQEEIQAIRKGAKQAASQSQESALHKTGFLDKNERPMSASDIGDALKKAASSEPQKAETREQAGRKPEGGRKSTAEIINENRNKNKKYYRKRGQLNWPLFCCFFLSLSVFLSRL